MIRLGQTLSLIFLVTGAMISCKDAGRPSITIRWTNNHPTALIVPKTLLRKPLPGGFSGQLQVRLENNATAIFGKYEDRKDKIIFSPLVSFSRGLTYEIYSADQLIGRVHVSPDSVARPPKLVAVYPSSDTVPENLLKCYLQFSNPMREGVALQHLVLINAKSEEVPGIFLDLQPELWNPDRTVLTVWLDPGRIKRDLIPNHKMGNPLQSGMQYSLEVRGGWKDAQGLPLPGTLAGKFIVGPRDSISPQVSLWKLDLPVSGSMDPLKILPGEALDFFLLGESIQILDENGSRVKGIVQVNDREKKFSFIPLQPWKEGVYKLQVDPKLEDLAGNNLERPFDRDLSAATPPPPITGRSFILSGQR